MRKRLLTRLAAAGAGGALALAVAGPGLAAVELKFKQDDALPISAAEGSLVADELDDSEEFLDCSDDRFNDLAENEDGWHFVAPNNSFTSITVVFQTDPDDVTETETFTGTPGDPGEFAFQDAGPHDNMHADIFTPAGWLLAEASAKGAGEGVGFFVLSGTCAGVPDEPENGEEEEDPREEEEDPVEDPKEEEDPDELPVTGAQVGGLLVLAVGLLAAGGAMLFVRRRQNLANLLES